MIRNSILLLTSTFFLSLNMKNKNVIRKNIQFIVGMNLRTFAFEMLQVISIKDYYKRQELLPMIDVRSPAEFSQGHIPKAVNIPLFSNEERSAVGTVYKQETKEKAIELGYEYVNPKLQYFLEESEKVAKGGAVVVHCWRGGMRSQSFAKHLHDNGFAEVYVIEGGYKSFRNYVLDFFAQQFQLRVLGGYTGSGKTYILQELAKLGEQVIDLEGLAHHKGSAFGALGEQPQPTSEFFENILFEKWRYLDMKKPVWIEDESARIGCVQLPKSLYEQMREQILYFIDIPKEERALHLVSDYAVYDHNALGAAVQAIRKRLGGQHVQAALQALQENDYFQVAMITLQYYDKAYLYGVEKRNRQKVVRIPLPTVDAKKNAQILIEKFRKWKK